MEAAHIGSKRSLNKALTRLVGDKGVIEKLETGSGTSSNTYLIKLPQNGTSINNPQPPVLLTGTPLSETIRVRGKYYRANAAYRMRIGAKNAQILDLIHASGDVGMSVEDIEKMLGIRKDNLNNRNLPELSSYELIIEVDGRYHTPHDVEERLEIHLEASKCNRSARKQRERHQYEREQDAQKRREAPSNKNEGLTTTQEYGNIKESYVSTPHRVNQVDGVVHDMTDDWDKQMDHELDCECLTCSIPKPRYAKLRRDVSRDHIAVANSPTTTPEERIAA